MSKKQDLADIRALLEARATKAVQPFSHVTSYGSTIGNPASQGPAVLRQFDDAVAEAQLAVQRATTDLARSRAREELARQAQRRTMAKMISRENAIVNTGRTGSRFGPNTVEIFASGLDQLGDDPSMGYV